MANKEDAVIQNLENSESWENLFRDEWTIVGENSSDKENTDAGSNENDVSSRSTEVIAARNTETINNEMGVIIFEKHEEDSDGISVIEESEAEQLVVNKKFSEIDDCKNHVLGALKMYDKTGEKTSPQVGTILNVVIACSLAAIIGLGAGRILGMDDKCPVSHAVDFSTIKIESNDLINQIKELTEVKDVLDEIRANIPRAKGAEKKMLQHESKSRSKRFERRERPSKIISDTYTFDPDTTILQQLQTSLNTLYSVIDDMNPDNDFVKSDALRTQGVVADLVEFKKIIFTVIKELEDTGGPKEMEFLRHAEQRIRDVCESLLNDLSYTVHGLTMKIHHKLNKVRRKLNKRLCLLKTSSESIDERIFQSLEENNSFLESCDKILNFTLKASPESAKPNKKEKIKKKTYLKKTSNLKKKTRRSIPESEDDTYPKDSSSDSSMPDLSYDPDDNNNIWKKKQISRQGEMEVKPKSGNKFLNNVLKRRKNGGAKLINSNRRRSLNKSIMEVLVPPECCPLTQEFGFQSDCFYPEAPHIETVILNHKPLYSTVLKSFADVKSSVGDNSHEDPLAENEEVIEDMDQEFSLEVVKVRDIDAADTKHDVTPNESGINFQTIQSTKNQWNADIRGMSGKYNGGLGNERTTQSQEILIEKDEDLQELENVEEYPLKPCRKGKKCSSTNFIASNDSDKRFASPTNNADDKQWKKIRKEKTANKKDKNIRNSNEKKPKKRKHEKKHLEQLKTENSFKQRNNNQKISNQLAGDWQLQRSRAREMHRDRNHRSEWFFDRADYRQDARKNVDEFSNTESGAGKFSCYQPHKSHRREECKPFIKEWIADEEFNHWNEVKDAMGQKHSNSRAGFTSKKMIKMPHRKNILQSKRR